MTIVRRPATSVGNEGVDQDPREPIDMIDAVEAALQGAGQGNAGADTPDAPTLHTHLHFERAPRLMEAVRGNGHLTH